MVAEQRLGHTHGVIGTSLIPSNAWILGKRLGSRGLDRIECLSGVLHKALLLVILVAVICGFPCRSEHSWGFASEASQPATWGSFILLI
jgi:hypothetical protein